MRRIYWWKRCPFQLPLETEATNRFKGAFVYEFKTHLFDDIIIDIREVFEGIE